MKLIVTLFAATIFLSTSAFAQDSGTGTEPQSVNESSASLDSKPVKALTLYNFKTEMEEDIADPQNMSVEKGKEFIPPLPVAEQLYLNYIEQGANSLEAVTYTYIDLRKAMSEVEASE